MSHFMSLVRRAPKRLSAIVAIVAAAVIIPAAVNAWGPSRQTFTIEKPADYVTFNSITDNPVHGDERNFVQIKDASASDSTYSDSITLTPGKTYTVFMYYHNNAATNLNASGVGIAHGAYVKAQLPAVVAKGSTDTKLNGFVGASNATPREVWDDVSLANSTPGDIAIRYVSGSATIHNAGKTNGATLSDSIISSGAAIGFDALNGDLPGCNDFSGYVTYNFVADQPNFTISKQVRVAGTTNWSNTTNANPGATVDFQLKYENTGTTWQNNVVLKDTLPANLTYISGSSYLMNSSYPTGKNVSDNLVAASGINIGNYAPGAVAYLKFSATVNSNKEVFCSPATLTNVASAETANGSKQASASVTVKAQTCAPGTISVCEIATKQIVTINDTNYDTTKYTTDLTKCQSTPPTTPPELPHTGMGESIVAVTGLGALIASAAYYIASRRALNR